jgi:hypothetical protein
MCPFSLADALNIEYSIFNAKVSWLITGCKDKVLGHSGKAGFEIK